MSLPKWRCDVLGPVLELHYGQNTAVFQRHSNLSDPALSFSIVYNGDALTSVGSGAFPSTSSTTFANPSYVPGSPLPTSTATPGPFHNKPTNLRSLDLVCSSGHELQLWLSTLSMLIPPSALNAKQVCVAPCLPRQLVTCTRRCTMPFSSEHLS